MWLRHFVMSIDLMSVLSSYFCFISRLSLVFDHLPEESEGYLCPLDESRLLTLHLHVAG